MHTVVTGKYIYQEYMGVALFHSEQRGIFPRFLPRRR